MEDVRDIMTSDAAWTEFVEEWIKENQADVYEIVSDYLHEKVDSGDGVIHWKWITFLQSKIDEIQEELKEMAEENLNI